VTEQDLQELLREGIAAARARNKVLARQKLVQVVKADPNNEMGWFWLASVLEGKEERIKSLKRVLKINPGNQKAREILNRLQAPATSTAPALHEAETSHEVASAPTTGGRQFETSAFSLDQALAPVEKALGRYGLSQRQARLAFGGGIILIIFLCFIIFVSGGGDDASDDSATDNTAAPTDISAVTGELTETPGDSVATPPETPTQEIPEDTPVPPTATLTPTITPTPTATVTPSPTETPTPPPPAPPEATGRMIIVSGAQSSEPLNQQVFILEPQTNALTQISPNQARGRQASLSPDGSRFVMVEYNSRFSRYDAQVISISDGSAALLDTLWVRDALIENMDAPAWAPSNTMIAFTGNAVSGGAGQNLYIHFFQPGEGQPPVREVPSDDNVSDPAWSPNASRIVYVKDLGGVTDLYVYEVGAGTVTQITRNASTITEDSPDWSPDDTRIAFSGIREGTTGADIYVMPADGTGEPELLFDFGENDINPRWSPDGRFIAFSSDVDGKFDIFIYDLQTETFYSVISDGTTWDIVQDWIR
jgi:Tol biopolymer transport system component